VVVMVLLLLLMRLQLLLLLLLLQLVLIAGVRVNLLSVGGLVVAQQLGRGAGGANGAPRGLLLVLGGAPAIQHVGVQGAGD